MKDSGGPYLLLAALCERTLVDTEGALSVIRMVDTWTIVARGPGVPENLPPQTTIRSFIAITLKAGRARGRHSLRVDLEKPSGEFLKGQNTPIQFEGEERGVNVIAPTEVQADQEGLYWFHVILNGDQLLTKIPLRVRYQPQQ